MDPEMIGVKAAQDSLSMLIERVRDYGETFVITRRGKPVAVLIGPGELAEMRAKVAGNGDGQ